MADVQLADLTQPGCQSQRPCHAEILRSGAGCFRDVRERAEELRAADRGCSGIRQEQEGVDLCRLGPVHHQVGERQYFEPLPRGVQSANSKRQWRCGELCSVLSQWWGVSDDSAHVWAESW